MNERIIRAIMHDQKRDILGRAAVYGRSSCGFTGFVSEYDEDMLGDTQSQEEMQEAHRRIAQAIAEYLERNP